MNSAATKWVLAFSVGAAAGASVGFPMFQLLLVAMLWAVAAVLPGTWVTTDVASVVYWMATASTAAAAIALLWRRRLPFVAGALLAVSASMMIALAL